MYRSLFNTLPRDLFAELDRLQRELGGAADATPAIRGIGRGGYPALNVASNATGVEVLAFAPGIDPASIEVHLDRGVLTIAGERQTSLPSDSEGKVALHINERFAGRFRRVLKLPDDIEPASVNAELRDGVVRVSALRKVAAQPRRITVQ